MPFNVWCLGCNQHIAKGVRFNAEKKRIDTYFSTDILSFRMKCHLCSNWMEIHTDPKNADYVCISGVRRKVEEYSAEAIGMESLAPKEHKVTDEKRGKQAAPKLSAIQAMNEAVYSNDYETSRMLRARFREEKKAAKEQIHREELLKSRLGLSDVRLPKERPEDFRLAHTAKRIAPPLSLKDQVAKIQKSSIFDEAGTSKTKKTTKLSFDTDLDGIADSLNLKK